MPSALESQQPSQYSVMTDVLLVDIYGCDSPYLPTGPFTINQAFLLSLFLSFFLNSDSLKPPLNLILFQGQVALCGHSISSKSALLSSQEESS